MNLASNTACLTDKSRASLFFCLPYELNWISIADYQP